MSPLAWSPAIRSKTRKISARSGKNRLRGLNTIADHRATKPTGTGPLGLGLRENRVRELIMEVSMKIGLEKHVARTRKTALFGIILMGFYADMPNIGTDCNCAIKQRILLEGY
jgi:hypothetical protein